MKINLAVYSYFNIQFDWHWEKIVHVKSLLVYCKTNAVIIRRGLFTARSQILERQLPGTLSGLVQLSRYSDCHFLYTVAAEIN